MIINCTNWHEFLENINDYHAGETELRDTDDAMHIVRKPHPRMSVVVLLGTWNKKTGKGKVFTNTKVGY